MTSDTRPRSKSPRRKTRTSSRFVTTRLSGRSLGATYSTTRRCGQPRPARSQVRTKTGGERCRWARLTMRHGGRAHAGGALDDGQTLAPAQAAAFEHRAAGGGQHAFHEAVLPSTRDALRLVRTLGHGRSVLRKPGEASAESAAPAQTRRAERRARGKAIRSIPADSGRCRRSTASARPAAGRQASPSPARPSSTRSAVAGTDPWAPSMTASFVPARKAPPRVSRETECGTSCKVRL